MTKPAMLILTFTVVALAVFTGLTFSRWERQHEMTEYKRCMKNAIADYYESRGAVLEARETVAGYLDRACPRPTE